MSPPRFFSGTDSSESRFVLFWSDGCWENSPKHAATVPFIVAMELVCGAAGALAIRWKYPAVRLGAVATAVVGAVGGYAMTLLAAHIPGIGRFVGQAENAADSMMRWTGGFTPALLIGVGISGLLGGAVLAIVVALLRHFAGAQR